MSTFKFTGIFYELKVYKSTETTQKNTQVYTNTQTHGHTNTPKSGTHTETHSNVPLQNF